MNNPDVLQSINRYLDIRTAVRLSSCSKMTHTYIKRRDYTNAMKKLDTSDVAKVAMILSLPYEKLFECVGEFKHIIQRLHTFKMRLEWNNEHITLYLAFLISYYLRFNGTLDDEFIELLTMYIPLNNEIINTLKMNTGTSYRDIYMLLREYKHAFVHINRCLVEWYN
jgi:hypothetical protein